MKRILLALAVGFALSCTKAPAEKQADDGAPTPRATVPDTIQANASPDPVADSPAPAESPAAPVPSADLEARGELANVADYDTPPRLVEAPRPVILPEAEVTGAHGVVEVEIHIDERGNVDSARVLHSIPHLDESALVTVRRWKFKPAMKNGRPVPVMAVAPVTFG